MWVFHGFPAKGSLSMVWRSAVTSRLWSPGSLREHQTAATWFQGYEGCQKGKKWPVSIGGQRWPAWPRGFRKIWERGWKRNDQIGYDLIVPLYIDLLRLSYFLVLGSWFGSLPPDVNESNVIPMHCFTAFILGCNVTKMEPSQRIHFVFWLPCPLIAQTRRCR